MTTIPCPPVIRSRTNLRWLLAIIALMLTPFIALAIVAVGVTSYLRLSSETNALRDEVIKSSGVTWRKQIALNVGGLTFGAARAGLGFARLPEEARVAFAAMRGVEVGVYHLPDGSETPDCAAMLDAAERTMAARGWERVVRVLDREELVTVYVPQSASAEKVVKFCVLVLDGDQMVIASVKAKLGPLIECGSEKLPGALKWNGQRFSR